MQQVVLPPAERFRNLTSFFARDNVTTRASMVYGAGIYKKASAL